MKSVIRATAVVIALLVGIAGSGAQPPSSITLSIVGTNDVHGGIAAEGGQGGLALFGGYVRNVRAARAADGGAVLLIDAGDMWQGTLESNLGEGASVVAAYNALGYAAAAIGNHEFDFGPIGPAAIPSNASDDARGALKARAAEAAFPFLAANLIDVSTGRPVEWANVRPSTIVETAGVKVGIIGVMTSEALTASIAANTRGLRIAPLAEVIDQQSRRLRETGATVVIVAAHAGGRCSRFDEPRDLSSCEASSEIFTVARMLRPGAADAIVAGHSHAGLAHEVGGIPITEAYSGGQNFGRVDLVIDRQSGRVQQRRIFRPRAICARENPQSLRCDSSGAVSRYEGADVVPDSRIEQILAPALRAAEVTRVAPVGVVLETAVRRGNNPHRSPLGQIFVDAMRDAMGGDIAINNTRGGLRADWPAGPLVYGSVYRAMPFDNRLVSLSIRAADLARVLAAELQGDAARVSLSGIRVVARCQAGALNVMLFRPPAEAIADDTMLDVVVTDFLALGGDGVLSPIMPAAGFTIPADGPLLRDVVADWLRARGGRVRQDDFDDVRWAYASPPPISCSP